MRKFLVALALFSQLNFIGAQAQEVQAQAKTLTSRAGANGAFVLARAIENGQVTAMSATQPFSIYSMSPNTGAHQGVAWDGAYYYIVNSAWIRKYDASWNLVTQNNNAIPQSGIAGVNHLGDPEIYNGEIYIPLEKYPNSPYNNQHIVVYSAATLDFLRSYEISAQAREISSIAYNPADGLLYVSDFTSGGSLLKYSLKGEYQGTFALSPSIPAIQGITFFKGKLYINSDSGDRTHRFGPDGTYDGVMFTSTLGGYYEGLSHNSTGLLVLVDTTTSSPIIELREGDASSNPEQPNQVDHGKTVAPRE